MRAAGAKFFTKIDRKSRNRKQFGRGFLCRDRLATGFRCACVWHALTRHHSASQATYAVAHVRGWMWLCTRVKPSKRARKRAAAATAACTSVRARAKRTIAAQPLARSQERASSEPPPRLGGGRPAWACSSAREDISRAAAMPGRPPRHARRGRSEGSCPARALQRCWQRQPRPLRRPSGFKCGPAGRKDAHDERTAVLHRQRPHC